MARFGVLLGIQPPLVVLGHDDDPRSTSTACTSYGLTLCIRSTRSTTTWRSRNWSATVCPSGCRVLIGSATTMTADTTGTTYRRRRSEKYAATSRLALHQYTPGGGPVVPAHQATIKGRRTRHTVRAAGTTRSDQRAEGGVAAVAAIGPRRRGSTRTDSVGVSRRRTGDQRCGITPPASTPSGGGLGRCGGSCTAPSPATPDALDQDGPHARGRGVRTRARGEDLACRSRSRGRPVELGDYNRARAARAARVCPGSRRANGARASA